MASKRLLCSVIFIGGCGGGDILAPDASDPDNCPDVDAAGDAGWSDGPRPAIPGLGNRGIGPSPWTELPEPMVALVGGIADSAGGTGGNGGPVRLIANGGVRLDPSLSPQDWPPIPPVPGGGEVVASADLAADVTRASTIRVADTATTGGSDPVRTITSTAGDIVVAGALLAGDLGGSGQSISLRAPAGTVFVTGIVMTMAPDGTLDGDAGGDISIDARQVVVGGQLIAGGEDASAGRGGDGGAISITASAGSLLHPGGLMWSAGGDGADRGGDGGAIRIIASDSAFMAGKACSHGGAATGAGAEAIGGAGGSLHVDVDGLAALAGTVDARGGPATADSAGEVTGGPGGGLLIGEVESPAEIQLLVPVVADGGAGRARGGNGGGITAEPHGGDLVVAGTIRTDGGDSRLDPGNGGVLTGNVGSSGGGIRISGAVHGRGGAATGDADTDGGDAGNLYLQVYTHTGPFVMEAGGEVVLDGGASSGTGRGGSGGLIDILTRDGDFSLAGRLFARGGEAPDPGGTGGDGGPVYIYTDTDADGIGGNQTIETAGVIDVSGGPGTHGGSARNNGEFGVEEFPAGRYTLAVLLNSDTATGELTDGEIQNLGMIIARGAAGGGWGGDVVYHGRLPGHDMDPLPGQLFVDGEGSGMDGQYYMQ